MQFRRALLVDDDPACLRAIVRLLHGRLLMSGGSVDDIDVHLRTGLVERFVEKPASREDLHAALQIRAG